FKLNQDSRLRGNDGKFTLLLHFRFRKGFGLWIDGNGLMSTNRKRQPENGFDTFSGCLCVAQMD
ncbi:MAG: hypothetical protein ACFNLD_08530, partial [Kingella oralis]